MPTSAMANATVRASKKEQIITSGAQYSIPVKTGNLTTRHLL